MPNSELPLYPASWYLFGARRELDRGPITKKLLGREIVAFRTESGQLAVMDARCPHFGADLGKGSVVGETVQCPYHGWRYGPDGACKVIPSGCAIPDSAKLRTYPLQERHGYLFFFNGETPSFPLPWFFDVAPDDYTASRPFSFTADSPWPTVTGHAFDIQHFLFVHDRRLLEPPVIDTPAPFVRRIRYRAEIVPRNWRDRVLSLTGGKIVTASLVIWGGTFAVITAAFGRFTSRFVMSMTPTQRRETRCDGIVFGRHASRLALAVRRYFTAAYLVDENRVLDGTISTPSRFVESDGPLAEYFDYLQGLSQSGER